MSIAANYPGEVLPVKAAREEKPTSLAAKIDWLIAPLGSQKIAVAAFAYGIFVIFIGTLAQTEKDIWQVMPEYFRAWIMWVDINLMPSVLYPAWKRWDSVPLIPMPGGMFVGITMIINMLFAHSRWILQLKAKPTALLAGAGLIGLGWLVTLLIILNGHSRGGFQAQPPFSWELFWMGLQVSMIAVWVVSIFSYVWIGVQPAYQQAKLTMLRVVSLVIFGVLLMGLSVLVWFLLFKVPFPGPSNLRIVWQLMQGTLAGIVVLGGTWLMFQKRGGVVLLHQGMLLLMMNELFVAHYAVEYNMILGEGQTTNVLRDIRVTEIALVDRSGKEKDQHIVVPFQMILANAEANQKAAAEKKPSQPIADKHDSLPVSVTVLQYTRNADLRKLKKDEKSLATAGLGLEYTLKPLEAAKGTDTSGSADQGAAYVQFKDKKSGADLGTYLLFVGAMEKEGPPLYETVKAGDKEYFAGLRFKRQFVPFSVHLVDVRKDDYVGTATPRNYSSDVVLKDNANGIDSKIHIMMNDPLRYSGLTFYQSNYQKMPTGEEYTTLSVVRNNGFLIPYVALMIITVGMIAHFLQTLIRFLVRRENEEINRGDIILAQAADSPPGNLKPVEQKGNKKEAKRDLKPLLASAQPTDWRQIAISVSVASVIFLIFLLPAMRQRAPKAGEFDFDAFGRLPVAQDGRVKPLDTVARNALLLMRQRETAIGAKDEKIGASQWLLDVISGSEVANQHRVLKIDDPDIRKLLNLKDKKGHVFSFDDMFPEFKTFNDQAEAARKLEDKQLSAQQRGIIKIAQGLQNFLKVKRALTPLPLPSVDQIKANRELAERTIGAFRMWKAETEDLKLQHPPRAIPVRVVGKSGEGSKVSDWGLIPEASLDDFMDSLQPNSERNAALGAFNKILDAYAAGKPDEFNTAVSRYEAIIYKNDLPEYNPRKLELESWFNHFSPFYLGMILYVIAFLIAMFGWLIPSKTLNWTAFTLILLTFSMHTAALVFRIYISGRPPVTNLYSSAVFIGWFCVFIGLIVELVFRIGIGNLVATLCGFSTLIIAYYLGIDGDTIGVMQAVLDTQFWLATHVVCITLGYGATYFAGFLGLLYVVLGMATPRLDGGSRKILARMIYGVTCFALFFSFFGTVLGGLWADDSWGRFWGWDPKENGALMIVLWNALVLHARWDKMVGDRGLALLSIGGNIITSWSWFGVNGLDVGLHSYGQKFGVMETLGVFVLSQLIIIMVGMVPLKYWWSVVQENLKQPFPS